MTTKSRVKKRLGYIVSNGIQKGGVGKTTTTCLESAILSIVYGYKVLVVDLDPQGNSTFFLTRRSIYDYTGNTILEAVLDENAKQYIVKVNENLHILPSEDRLSDLEEFVFVDWRDQKGNQERYEKFEHLYMLKNILDPLREEYDFIILDLPPNPGLMTRMGLVASDFAMVLMSCDMLCYEAVSRYLAILHGVQSKFNKTLRLLGIAPSIIDSRAGVDTGFLAKARTEYGDWVFNTVTQRKTKVKEFAALGISSRTKADREALAQYEELVKEMLDRVNKFTK